MTREETLKKAHDCVCQSREADYGSPEDSFKTISQLWTAYLGHDISAADVAIMMALLKIARLKGGHFKEDSFVDLAGYAACGAEIATENGKVADPNIQNVPGWACRSGPDYVKFTNSDPLEIKRFIKWFNDEITVFNTITVANVCNMLNLNDIARRTSVLWCNEWGWKNKISVDDVIGNSEDFTITLEYPVKLKV